MESRKIRLSFEECTEIVESLKDNLKYRLAQNISERWAESDPANDGIETELFISDPYILIAREEEITGVKRSTTMNPALGAPYNLGIL